MQRSFEAPFQRHQTAHVVTVGRVQCPVVSQICVNPGLTPAHGFPETRVAGFLDSAADLGSATGSSLSPVRRMAEHPVCCEAELCCTPKADATQRAPGFQGQPSPFTIERDPRADRVCLVLSVGRRSLDEDFELMLGVPDQAHLVAARHTPDGAAHFTGPSQPRALVRGNVPACNMPSLEITELPGPEHGDFAVSPMLHVARAE